MSKCGDNDSLENVYKFLTCYIYLKKRPRLCDWVVDDIFHMTSGLSLVAGCFTGKETPKLNVLKEIAYLLDDGTALGESPNLLLFCCIRNVSSLVRESVWSTP